MGMIYYVARPVEGCSIPVEDLDYVARSLPSAS